MANTIPSRAELIRDPILLLAFGFGSGCAPKAPGTFGTLAALPLAYAMIPLPLWLYCAITLVAALAGVWICQHATNKMGVHDHGGIVWDEFVGLWIALIAVPQGWYWPLLGFVLFRLFDIAKPWPISWLDKKVHGGFGIMIDDILAGLLAAVCLQLVAISAPILAGSL